VVAEASAPTFVLSGGGNLGALQVGMLQALIESGVEPRMIVGTVKSRPVVYDDHHINRESSL
jgi:hypothetical protein